MFENNRAARATSWLNTGRFRVMRARGEAGMVTLVETAVGEVDPHADASGWKRDSMRLGQVATPQPIAALMARWAMSNKPARVLDPAAGLGSLLHECRKLNADAALAGVERDRQTLDRATLTAPRGTRLVLADYLLAALGEFDAIIANPPYVKAHRLDYPASTWRRFETACETRLDRLTNLYALFLLKIWRDLAPRGRAAVLLPAEFLNANFGAAIKARIVSAIRPPALLVFSPNLKLFADALTTSAIVLLEKRGMPADGASRLVKVDSVAEADVMVQRVMSAKPVGGIELGTLDPRAKWLNIVLNGASATSGSPQTRRVGDYFTCSRGIATGANDYFTLSASELREHGLERSHVAACVTKSSGAAGLIFTPEKFHRLVVADRKCFLLNPRDGREQDEAVPKYLALGQRLGIPQRFLPGHRPCWYLPENRAVADIWVAVFSRRVVKFILNRSGARNLTCFHGLYPKPGCESLSPLLTLYLNSSAGRQAFLQVNRFYGGGLNKLEPRDVEDLPCPEMPNVSPLDATRLTEKLAALEGLADESRQREIDRFASEYFGPGERFSRRSGCADKIKSRRTGPARAGNG